MLLHEHSKLCKESKLIVSWNLQFCTITASTTIPPHTNVPDFTVTYAGFEHRIDSTMKSRVDLQKNKMLMHTKQIEIFRKLIPNNVAKWQ